MNVFDRTYLRVKNTIWAWLTDEEGDVNVVSIVVLIGIAVVLAIALKDRLADLIKDLFTGMNTGDINKSVDFH